MEREVVWRRTRRRPTKIVEFMMFALGQVQVLVDINII
jgi:hypothetical protein